MPRTSKTRAQVISVESAVELLGARVTLLEAMLMLLAQRLGEGDKQLTAMVIDVAAARYQPLLAAPGSPLAEVLMERMRQFADVYSGYFRPA